MNKEFEVNGVQYMAVEVPEGANGFKIEHPDIDPIPLLFWTDENGNDDYARLLPEGTWEIVGLAGELSIRSVLDITGDNPNWMNDNSTEIREVTAKIAGFQEKYNLNDNSLIIKKI